MSTPTKRPHTGRIRKPNPRFDNEEDFHSSPRSRKQTKPQKSLAVAQPKTPDRRMGQALVNRLRNLLKLPKAHKWVLYEWFYSTIDSVLLEGENDFCMFLSQSFPQLSCRKLRRVEWCAIRRLMGKPRRCSEAFFAEERICLSDRRERIRILQQQKTFDLTKFLDMPNNIPLPLVIGTTVTARLRYPQDGLFTGTIDAVDTLNNSYRIMFDRPDLGPHSIPDYEVQCCDKVESVPLSSFQVPPRRYPPTITRYPNMQSPNMKTVGVMDYDPLLGSSPLNKSIPSLDEDGVYGGFPAKLLVNMIKLTKILDVKKEKVDELKDMNGKAELSHTRGDTIPPHFQQNYANKILDLADLNRDLNEYINSVKESCKQIANDHFTDLPDETADIKNKCEVIAQEMVKKANRQQGHNMVRSEHSLELISNLSSILLQIKCFAENDMGNFEFRSLQDSMNEIRRTLDDTNLESFQDNVEVHMNHIQTGLTSRPTTSSSFQF